MGGENKWNSFVRGIKLSITFIFSHVGLCAFVAAYTVAGAFLFRELENKKPEPTEPLVIWEAEARRNDLINRLYNTTETLAEITDPAKWNQSVSKQLLDFEKHLVEAVQNQTYDQVPTPQGETWTVLSSIFFCVTVITTIGYGNLSPTTDNGKMVCIAYAILGIPLMLLCLTNIGNSMATSFRWTYRRVCCCCCQGGDEEEEEDQSSPASQQNNSESGEAPPPAPYTPPAKYKPSRKNMLISPPISATIHRGSDNPLKLASDSEKPSTHTKVSTPKPRITNANLTLTDIEANRIVAECAAYTKTPVPGVTVPSQNSHHDCHDYDMVTTNNWLSPPSTTHQSPQPSSPSSPLSRDAPADWLMPVQNGGPQIVIETTSDHSPSNSSTRPVSPAFTNSTHHASNTSLAVSSSVGRPWPPSTTGTLMPPSHVNDLDEPPLLIRERPPHSPGKTLMVYNTLSGDALLEQSKVAKRMALMNKVGQVRQDTTTVFTDPVSGQAINGDMLGLSYRPIPPDTSDEDNRVPIPIVLMFVASYLAIGALLFQQLEGWTFLNSFYFCFITLSTIGFGDYVPGKSLGYETQGAQIKLVIGSLYLMLGLAVLAMSFSLVQEEVVLKCKAFALWIGLLKE